MTSLSVEKSAPNIGDFQGLKSSPNIFDRYKLMGLVVLYRSKPSFREDDEPKFRHLLNLSGAIPPEASKKAILKLLNNAATTAIEITEYELDMEFPSLASISKSLSLSFVEKLVYLFVVNFNGNFNYWVNLTCALGDMQSKAAAYTIAEMLQLDPSEVHLILSSRSRLQNSGLLERNLFANVQKPLWVHFIPYRAVDIVMLQSRTAWDDFLESRFHQSSQDSSGLDFSHITASVTLIVDYLSCALSSKEKGVHVLLYGPPGTGKTTLAREIARRLKLKMYEVEKNCSTNHQLDGVHRFKSYSFGQRLGVARDKCLMLFDEMEDLLPDQQSKNNHKGWICETLEKTGIPTIWTTNSLRGVDPAVLRRFTFTLEIPVPPKEVRLKLLKQYLKGSSLPLSWLKHIASIDSLTPAMMKQMSVLAPSFSTNTEELEAALNLWLSGRLKAMGKPDLALKPEKKPHRFDCGLMNSSLDPKSIITGLKEASEGRLCLYGPPGTGKTAFSQFIAEALGLESLIKRGSDLRSKWVGQTDQNIARMFADATRDGSVIILDEADSFLSGRTERTRTFEISEVSEFLVQLENFQGIFCATTNRFEDIDPAFMRRFDLKIKLNYLSVEQRCLMFKILLRESGLYARINADSLSRLKALDQLTPGDYMTAKRRLRFSNQECNQKSLLSALENEMDCKTVNQGRRIGFI